MTPLVLCHEFEPTGVYLLVTLRRPSNPTSPPSRTSAASNMYGTPERRVEPLGSVIDARVVRLSR